MIAIEAPDQFGTQDITVDGASMIRIVEHGKEFMVYQLRFKQQGYYYPTRAEALGRAMDWIANELY